MMASRLAFKSQKHQPMRTRSIPHNGYNSLHLWRTPQSNIKSTYVSRKRELYGRKEEREKRRARPALYQYYVS